MELNRQEKGQTLFAKFNLFEFGLSYLSPIATQNLAKRTGFSRQCLLNSKDHQLQ